MASKDAHQPLATAPTKGVEGGADKSRAQSDLDCLGCRLTGFAFGVGGGGYLLSHLLSEPAPKGAHRVVIVASAATLAALGVYRALGL